MVSTTISLRPFVPGDQPAARRLILQGLGDPFGFIDETLNPDLDDIAAHYLARGHPFLVALCQQRLVGTGALLFQPDRVGQIVRVSTSRAYRRQGIAASICLQLISLARQHALSRLIVETTHDWYDAIGLYQKLGFVEYQRVRQGVYLARDLT
ncbi:MAG TPA: GNAT family N-acetyltransferase [Ktedonobacteraceae bacterium]|jgi:ribosomal protein S18 acetylase RimI-like enzyme